MLVKFVLYVTVVLIDKCSTQIPLNVHWPRCKTVPSCRSTPININSRCSVPVAVSPLLMVNGYVEKAVVVNTGTAVETRIVQQRNTSYLTGGVLYNETYVYNSCRFFWTDNTTGIAEHSINGVGTPLAVEMYYYKKSYESFNNSLTHNDGLVILSFLIRVESTPNPLFNVFNEELQRVTVAESQIIVNIGPTFGWYIFPGLIRDYYSYPGSYTDINTGLIYNSATVIVFPFFTNAPFISRYQFNSSFRLLKDKTGCPLTNVAHRHHADGRPISYANGFVMMSNNHR